MAIISKEFLKYVNVTCAEAWEKQIRKDPSHPFYYGNFPDDFEFQSESYKARMKDDAKQS